jgi:hypothetical protein
VEGKADSYRTEETRLLRVATALADIPKTVTVVPEQVMDEQRATTVREAVRNVSGITMPARATVRARLRPATADYCSFRYTPMTIPMMFTLLKSRLRTMIGSMVALAGWKRMISPSG